MKRNLILLMVIAFSVSMMVIGIGCKDDATGKTAEEEAAEA